MPDGPRWSAYGPSHAALSRLFSDHRYRKEWRMIYATTKRDKIRDAPDAYYRQYHEHFGEVYLASGRDPYDNYRSLRVLNLETCSEADVAEAIGNPLWTELKCDHCEIDQQRLVTIEGPYESFSICSDCLTGAASAMSAGAAATTQIGAGLQPASAVAAGETPNLQAEGEEE